MFTVQYTDVRNKVCEISCLYYISLSHVFDNPFQNIIYRISANVISVLALATKIPFCSGPNKNFLPYFNSGGPKEH